jgi:Zn finger protein HypA/HybF involved in hydrogenase expression
MKKKLLILLTLSFLTVLFSLPISAAQTLRPHHRDNGLSCEDCHTTSQAEAVPMEQCLTCHTLPEPKSDYHGAPDKHDSPHYGPELECENCHHEHEESENFCADCHDFDFKVP